ncbi:hypothetical protein SISSUDRAFT_1131519 [Sistotremastrum suecicum HHB10207 ss-3]|uniref:Spt20-like SEP domain-containing protein n=1 Tax=Sistotremastrum suecicum HHB10207 ss-3 TaxID=1314776 RepID=A0A166A2D6_9AGAM|nr:hypothetical protein SISSUDRAFT_1131519 [Sistotremastrum suecicum HHB10207 ss-3]
MDYNQTRFTQQFLKKYQKQPVSFTVQLYHDYWLLNQAKFLYSNQASAILEDIRALRVPVDFLEIFDEAKVPFYEGRLIVELLDWRSPHRVKALVEKPESHRVVLHPNEETLWADICLLNSKRERKFTDREAIEIEAAVINATAPPLCLDPDVNLTRIVNTILRASSPTIPASLKRKQLALDPEEDETERAKRARIMQFMNPRYGKQQPPPSYKLFQYFGPKKYEMAQHNTQPPIASQPQPQPQPQAQPPNQVSQQPQPHPPPQFQAPQAPTPVPATSPVNPSATAPSALPQHSAVTNVVAAHATPAGRSASVATSPGTPHIERAPSVAASIHSVADETKKKGKAAGKKKPEADAASPTSVAPAKAKKKGSLSPVKTSASPQIPATTLLREQSVASPAGSASALTPIRPASTMPVEETKNLAGTPTQPAKNLAPLGNPAVTTQENTVNRTQQFHPQPTSAQNFQPPALGAQFLHPPPAPNARRKMPNGMPNGYPPNGNQLIPQPNGQPSQRPMVGPPGQHMANMYPPIHFPQIRGAQAGPGNMMARFNGTPLPNGTQLNQPITGQGSSMVNNQALSRASPHLANPAILRNGSPANVQSIARHGSPMLGAPQSAQLNRSPMPNQPQMTPMQQPTMEQLNQMARQQQQHHRMMMMQANGAAGQPRLAMQQPDGTNGMNGMMNGPGVPGHPYFYGMNMTPAMMNQAWMRQAAANGVRPNPAQMQQQLAAAQNQQAQTQAMRNVAGKRVPGR